MAANTKISYSVGLNVDTKQAKQDMNELMKSIAKISDQAIVSFDTKQVKEGIEAARELERHLSKAFDVKTGNLDLSKFSASIKQSNGSLEQLATKLQSFGPTGQASFNQLANAINSAQVPLKRTSSMVDNLMINLKKTAQWQLSSTIIHGAQSQISQAISYVKNLNSSLTNIAIVSDLSSKQLANFAVQAQQMGKTLATSTLDVTNAALIYFQQGDSVLQAMEKAAITIKAANASANSSAAEMSEYLTAIWNSYKVGSAELEQYVDVMAALGAKTASSMEEIATAMQKVAATANTVGVEFDQMSSIISTVSSVTRESAESIGTSYKTILARIGDLKLGTLVEDGATVTLGQVSGQLKEIGINVLDAKGDMRDMGAVIEEIGFKWQGMNDAQKAAVAQTIAGKRQYTQLMALFENWDMYQQNMTISANADGSLDQMQETWATSWEAASNRVRNSLEGIYSSLIDDSFVTGALNVIAEFVSGIDSVIDKMGGLGGVISLVGGLFATKLGGRTTEIIDALKTNLGLMTGSTKRQMIELNREMETLAAKQESAATSPADKVHATAMKRNSAARATYLKNQDRLSLEERAAFDAKSKRFTEVAEEKEAVDAERAQIDRQNKADRRKRNSQFFDSSLIHRGDPSEASSDATAQASILAQEAQAAQEEARAAHELVVAAQAEQDALQAELDALTEQAIQAAAERDAKIAEAAKNKDAGGQRGLLKQAEEKENELTELNEQIEAKKAELAEAQKKVDAAKTSREEKNAIMKEKKKASRHAKQKAKDLGKDNSSTQELKKLQAELKSSLKGSQVAVKLSDLIKFQEDGKSASELSKAGGDLFEAMEEGLLDSAKKANLGDQLNNIIDAKIKDIEISMTVNGDGNSQQVLEAKQALQELQTLAASSGFSVDLDVTGISTLQDAKTALTSMQTQIVQAAQQAGASEEAIAKLMEAFGIDPADIQSIRAAGTAMGELEGRSSDLGNSLNQLGSDMEGAAIPTTTVLDAFTSVIGAAFAVVGAIEAVSGAFETITDPDATGIEKVTAALTAMGAIIGVVTGVTSTLRTVDEAYITSQAKKLVGIKAANLEEAKSIVLSEMNTGARKKSVAAIIMEKMALVAHTVAQWAANAAKIAWHALSGPAGWALLAGAAVAIGVATVAIIKNTNEQKRLNEEMEKSNATMEANANAIHTLKGDLVSLASILDNTSLSYEEQLEKINEVTSAYGVQATMLDVLSGNYGRLAAEMTNAVAAEASITRASMEANYTNRKNTISEQMDSNGWWIFGDTEYWGDRNNRFLKEWDNTKISTAEKDWLAQSGIDFSQYGMTLNKNGQLQSTRDLTPEDYMGLYSAMTAAGVQDQNFSSDSYMGKMLTQMEDEWDLDSLDRLEEQIAEAKQFENLLTQHADEFDMLNLEGRERTLEDMYSLLGNSMGLTESDDMTKWAEYLGQYDHWAPASQQLLAVEQQAAEVAAMNGVDQEVVSKAMQEALFPGEDGQVTIDVETLIRVNPSDIVWNDDGTFDISEEARALAQAQVDKQKAIDTQAKIDEVSKIASNETLTRDDYSTIAASGLFEEGSEEFNQFMIASPATRAMILKQKQMEAEQDELTALQAEVENATALSEQYKTRYQEYLANLKDSLVGTSLAGDFGDLEGEELYRAMIQEKAKIEDQLNYAKNYQDMTITEDTSEEDAEAYKQAALAAMSAEDAAQWRNKTAQEIYEGWGQATQGDWDVGNLQADFDAIELATAQGEALEAGISDTFATMTAGMDEIEAIEWWNNTGKAIAEATTAAEGFADAIGKIGKLSAKELAELQLVDPNALSNYQNMDSTEWNEYAYEQSMIYYDNLLALYDKDSIEYITTLQEKEEATKTYYDTIREQQEEAADAILSKWEEEKEAVEAAVTSLNDVLSGTDMGEMSFEAIEQLRQNLLEVGYTAEEVDAILRNLGKEETDEASVIEAMKLKTNLLLKNMGNAQKKSDAMDGLLGDSTATLSLKTDIDHEGLAADGEGGYSATLTTDPENGTRILTLKTDTTKVLGLKNNGNGTYTVTYSLNGDPSKTLTLSDDVNLTDLHKNENDEVVVSYTTPDGTGRTLTLGEEFNLTNLKMTDGNKVAVSYTTPDGTGRTLTLGEEFNLDKLTMGENNSVIVSYTTPDGTGRTLSLSEDVSLDELSMDENNNITVHYTTPDGTTRRMWLREGVALSKLHINDDGNVEVGYTLPDGNTQTFTLSGGATIDKADYDADSKTWTILTSNGETVTFDGTMTGNGWSEKDGKYVYTTTGGITVETTMVPATGSDELPADGSTRTLTYRVNYQSDLGAIAEVRANMTTAWSAEGKDDFLEKAKEYDDVPDWLNWLVSPSFSDQTNVLMTKYQGDIAAFAADTGKSAKEIGTNIASIGAYVDAMWQDFLTQAGGDEVRAWELASQDSGFMYGYNLYAGLINGYQSAYGDYGNAVVGVSNDLLLRIQKSLGENSPSKYTHAMGEYLMIGLQQGFDSVEFDTSGVEAKILNPIKEALIAARGDVEAEIDALEGILSQVDPDGTTVGDIVESEVENVDENGITTKSKRYTYGGIAYVNKEDAIAAQTRDRQTYASQNGYNIVSQQNPENSELTQYGVQYADQTIQWFENENEAIVHAYMSALSDNAVAESFASQISSGVWSDQFNVLQQHYLNEASEDAFKDINAQYENRWDNIAELLASGNQEAIDAFYAAFNTNISKIGQELEGDVNIAWAQIQDTWADGFTTIFKGEQDLAQKTYDLWIDTFNSIVAAREAIIEGKDWSGLSTQDKVNLYRDWQQESGITAQTIMQRTFSTSKDRIQHVQFDPYYNQGNDPDATYGSSVLRGPDGLVVLSDAATAKTRQQTAITTSVTQKMESGGLIWNYSDALPILNNPEAWRQAQVEGNATYKTWAADEANAGKTWMDWLTSTDEGKSFGVDLETNEAMAATLASLDDTLITFDETIGEDGAVSRTYRLKDGAPADGAPAAGFEDDIAAKVVAYLMSGWTDEGFYDYQANELAADATYLGEIRSLQQKEYEAKIEANQGYQQILDEAYNAGGVKAYLDSFEDPAERQAAWTDLSEAYQATTGKTLTLNTSLDDLETASENAASAVTKFSNALLWIMDKVVSGYTDFQMDEKTGVVTATKTYGDVTYNDAEKAYYSGTQKITLGEGQSYGAYDATAGTLVIQASSVSLPGYANQPTGMSTNEYEAGMSEAANAGQSATDVWHQTHDYDWETGFNQANSQFNAMSSMNGIDPTDFDAWTQGIESLSSAYEGMGDAQAIIDKLKNGTIDWATANEELTTITMKAGRGIEEMSDVQYEQWKQMLKNNKVTVKGYKTLDDYFKSCDKGRKIAKKMTQQTKKFVDEMDDAGTEANRLINTLDEFEDVDLDGVMDPDETGWDELMDTLVPEEFQGITDELLSVWTQFGGDWDAAIRAGFDQTTGAFNDSTIQLLTAMGLNADQIKALQDQTKQALADGAAMGDINFLSMIADMDVDNVPFDSMIESLNSAMRQIYAAAAKMGINLIPATWQDIPTLASKGVGAHGGGGSSGGGRGNNGTTGGKTPSGGGGGGGGGDPQQKDKKEYDDEIERYHEIQEEMERTQEALDQIEKKKERAYGKKYLALMDQEIAKIKENIEEQQRYQDEIAGYLAQDRQAAAALGAQFDAEGNITNYTAVMQSIIDDYNAAVEMYNAGNMTDEEFEDIEEQYEDAMEALEQYEETLELSAEAQADFLELQNQLSQANLEKITYKIEIVTELNEGDLEILEYYQEMYEDNLDKQDDLMRNLTQQAQEYEANVLVLNEAMAELQAKFASGEINEADFAEGMQELREQAIEYASNLEDLKDQFVEVYEDALDLAAEQVENFTEKMQDSADMMDTYISLTQLMGRGTNYRDLEKFYETQYKANLANLETQRAYVDSLEEQAAYFEEQIANGVQLTETEQKQYEALQDALREANSELASTTEAALQSVQAAYENSINAIFKELDASIAGTAGSLADLADQYAYYQEEQSRYVSTAKELYEVSKLNRSIEQSLEDATTDASKAKLKALQEEINLMSEKNDLSEYDIEMMNLQYQLTLAQIALEEAQASKDTVRLTRDQDGNMAYQYTANQEKVSQAQQEYENVLQQINDLASNRVSELEQQCLTAEQQYLQSAQEILLDTTLTDEQRTQKLEELSQRYSETLLYIQGQYNNASQALTQNQQAVAEHYGQALVNSMGEASLQMNTVIGDMIGNAQSHIDAFNQAIEEGSMGAWSDYMDGVAALTNASGLTYDNLIANADDYAEVAENANQAAQDLIDTFTDSFEDINAATEQWDAHLATLEGVQQMYENIATSAQNTLEVLSGFTGAEGVGDTTQAIAALLGITPTNPANTTAEGTPDNLIATPRPPVTIQEEAQAMIEGWTDEYLDQIIQMYEEAQIHTNANAIEEYVAAGSGKIGGGGGKWNEQIAIQEYQMIQQSLMEQLHNFYAAQDGFAHASGYSVAGGGANSLEQHVEIVADFPNATNQEEIRMAFEELINLASQHVYSSAAISKNR